MVSHYNFQILLLGQRVKISGEVQKRTEIAQCRMAHKDEMVATASERIIKVRRLVTNNTNLQWAGPVLFCIFLNNQSMASRHQVQLDPTWQQSSIKRRSESNRPDNRKRYPLAQMVNSTPQAELTATEILIQDKQMTLGTCRHVRH